MRRTTGLHRERGRSQRLARDLTAEEVRAEVVLGNERVVAVVAERLEVEELSNHLAAHATFRA